MIFIYELAKRDGKTLGKRTQTITIIDEQL